MLSRFHSLTGAQRWAMLFAVAAVTRASGADAPASASSTNAPAFSLPPITVTAEKRAENVQDVPASDTVVTKDTLNDAGIRTVKEAAAYAPGVFMKEYAPRAQSYPSFRGIGAGPDNPGVTTYIDGVPQLHGYSSSIELIDVDQVDFLRGPQSVLFGRNAEGGIISITSTRPSVQDWAGGVNTTYGNYNLFDLRATATGPIIKDELGLGFGFGYSSRDGYTKNDFTGRDVDSREAYFGKGQLLWKAANNWEVRLILRGEHSADGDYPLGDLLAIRANPGHVSHDYEGHTGRDIIAPTLSISRAGEKVDVSLVTGLTWWDNLDSTDYDYSPFPLVIENNHEKDFQFTEEFRIGSAKDSPLSLSDDFKVKWQTGALFFLQNYNQDKTYYYLPGSLFPFSPANSQTFTGERNDVGIGGYAQLTLTAWDKVDLTGGVRLDYENKEAKLGRSFDPFLGPFGTATALDASKGYTKALPQVSLSYRLAPGKSLYATVSEGFKAGGFNSGAPAGSETYGSETSWNYEVGAKTSWLDNRLTANLAFFYTHWDNLQLYIPPTFYIGNSGAADSKGVELELNARAAEGLDLFAGGSLMDARYLNNSYSAGVYVGGKKVPYAPDFSANTGVQYSLAVCKEATVYARAEAIVTGNYQYDDANTISQSAYTTANFRAGIKGKNWYAEGWVRNAFNAHYVPIAFGAPFPIPGSSGSLGEIGAPVTFGVSAGLRF